MNKAQFGINWFKQFHNIDVTATVLPDGTVMYHNVMNQLFPGRWPDIIDPVAQANYKPGQGKKKS